MENNFINQTMGMYAYLPLRDVVFQTLRQAILIGELKPGERLMEIHLANELGVSRTPIREAIRKLELEGLVVMVPRKGAYVASISEQQLLDVLEVRRALETLSVSLACERITQNELDELKKACSEFEETTYSMDATGVARADVRFHDIILRATKNNRLVSLLNQISEQMYRYRFEYIKDTSNYSNLVKEHEELYYAMTNQDAERAVEVIRIHIDNQAAAVLKSIE